jgi:hypothetical protein
MRLRPGLELVGETVGDGAPVERQHYYRIRLRMWLNKGEPVRWEAPWGDLSPAEPSGDGTTMISVVRLDRECLVNGLFYGILGMRIGGLRRLRIAPRLAYGERGVPGRIPADALLTAEVEILAEEAPA